MRGFVCASLLGLAATPGGRCACYARCESPMVRGIVVNRAITPCTAFLTGCLVVCATRIRPKPWLQRLCAKSTLSCR